MPYALYAPNAATASTSSNLLGTLPDAQLSTNVARLNSSPVFTGNVTAPSFTGAFSGNGVALAAIQGLNQIVKEKEARIERLEKDVAELKAMVNSLLKN